MASGTLGPAGEPLECNCTAEKKCSTVWRVPKRPIHGQETRRGPACWTGKFCRNQSADKPVSALPHQPRRWYCNIIPANLNGTNSSQIYFAGVHECWLLAGGEDNDDGSSRTYCNIMAVLMGESKQGETHWTYCVGVIRPAQEERYLF